MERVTAQQHSRAAESPIIRPFPVPARLPCPRPSAVRAAPSPPGAPSFPHSWAHSNRAAPTPAPCTPCPQVILVREALQAWPQNSSSFRGLVLALRGDTVTKSRIDPLPPSGSPCLPSGMAGGCPACTQALGASVYPGQGLSTPTQPAWAGSIIQSHSWVVQPLSPVACGPKLHGLPAGSSMEP
jgi:hypothetical protein